jgi:hypothetical protein
MKISHVGDPQRCRGAGRVYFHFNANWPADLGGCAEVRVSAGASISEVVWSGGGEAGRHDRSGNSWPMVRTPHRQ